MHRQSLLSLMNREISLKTSRDLLGCALVNKNQLNDRLRLAEYREIIVRDTARLELITIT